jgi:hypothetical protein
VTSLFNLPHLPHNRHFLPLQEVHPDLITVHLLPNFPHNRHFLQEVHPDLIMVHLLQDSQVNSNGIKHHLKVSTVAVGMFKVTAVLHRRVMEVLLDPGTEIQLDMASKGVFSLAMKGDKVAKVSP